MTYEVRDADTNRVLDETEDRLTAERIAWQLAKDFRYHTVVVTAMHVPINKSETI